MKHTRAVAAITVLLGVLAPAAAQAANKEHQQLMAEIRMLQEQQQQLQQLLGGLADTLKTISTRMDDQTNVQRKAFADQKLLIDGVADTARILREKADDTNVRLSSMTQEIQALRQTVASMPPSSTSAPATPASGETPPGDPSGQPPAGTGTSSPPPPPPNVSPTQLYDRAFADYTGGHWDLAVEGFQAFIRTFPRSPQADDAQLYIGNSLYAAGRYAEAATALQKVISDYSTTESVPPAYYKLGLTYESLKQPDLARKAYETVIKNSPGTIDAQLAQQSLERLKTRKE